jgi:hypothetical protein
MAFTAQDNREVAILLVVRDLTLGQGFKKSDLTAAVSAADAWATTNATSFNTALPDPFKTSASTAQKNLLLAYVCMRRAGVV